VAGVPPDYFSATGQLWGNPLYAWDVHKSGGFAWWRRRLSFAAGLYGKVRLDHFRAFESYFSIPAGAPDARFGEWVKGPGLAFINAVNAEFSGARIIAEDLGFLTAEVRSLLAASGYPGMKVLQFAFDSREASDYMPYTYRRNCAAYTGTHDNSTVLGWFKSADPADVKLAIDYLGISGNGPGEKCWAFIRAVLSSVADLAIVPMQDYLCLDDRARMNTPSTLGGNNWCWRMLPLVSQAELAGKIRRLTEVTGR
jgi:4-alpha-glucanotransferase